VGTLSSGMDGGIAINKLQERNSNRPLGNGMLHYREHYQFNYVKMKRAIMRTSVNTQLHDALGRLRIRKQYLEAEHDMTGFLIHTGHGSTI
jgi:hypothetical protein